MRVILMEQFLRFLPGSGIPERLFPNNKFEIFFNLGDKVKGKSNVGGQTPVIEENIVSGIRHSFFDFEPPSNYNMVGMRFTLFGFNQLFHCWHLQLRIK